MTPERITELAKQAELYLDGENTQQPFYVSSKEELKRFYELARNDVLEEAAKTADELRRQHEAIKVLREALQSIVESDAQAILEAEAIGVPFPEELVTEYRKAKQALKDTEGL